MAIVFTRLQHSRIEQSSTSNLQAFQRKIYLKAKANPDYRFYCLYDKVFRMDVLTEAYQRVKANKGSSGVDGMTFADLEDKERDFLAAIHHELKHKTYRPNKLKEVNIPKKNGTTRTLRIPTIRDRVVQQAVKLVIEPIFEADFKDCSYGYRPKRSAHDEIGMLAKTLFSEIYAKEGKTIESVDLSNCFDTIPHRELIQLVARRLVDRALLSLIKAFLVAGVMQATRGTPQGGVVSPLLANIYLNRIDTYWQKHFKTSRLYRYADDIVAVLTKPEAARFDHMLAFIEGDLKLIINREKSHRSTVREGIDALGFTLREKTSRNRKQYLAIEPSRESMNRIREKIRKVLRSNSRQSTEDMIKAVNTMLKGWRQYFDNIHMGKTRARINWFVNQRAGKMISMRQKRKKTTWKLLDDHALYDPNKYGLYFMQSLGRRFT